MLLKLLSMECVYFCYYLVFLVGLLCYCVIASDWPEGYYGLPMANTGCPNEATFDWKSGWIYQDTEKDYSAINERSASFNIEGRVEDNSVNRSFCIKTQIMNDQRRPLWPAGTYCIYKKENKCPLGFKSGSIFWDDEDTGNNKKNGTLPDVDSSIFDNTKIYFCCRNDQVKTNPMKLPTGSPFYLFAHENIPCQQVKWAVATSEWIKYCTENSHSANWDILTAPFVEEDHGQNTLKIYYCYYTSCQYTLNTSTGIIKFPSHPGNYASAQRCSWRITVKPYQTIQVHFNYVHFALGVYDQLIFYDGEDDSASCIAVLHGQSTGSDTSSRGLNSSSSNLFLVFSSNDVYTASGFEASYTAIDNAGTVPPPTTARVTTRTTTEAQVITEKTNTVETTTSSRDPPSWSSSEPSSLPKGNSSKNYDGFKKTCIQQSQSTLIAVAIVIPLICFIAVIVMAVYLFLRLRSLRREKPSEVSVRYTTTTEPSAVNNPVYVGGDDVIEASAPSASGANNACEDNKGDIYQEIEPSRQAIDNPLYQSTNDDKHVYASFA